MLAKYLCSSCVRPVYLIESVNTAQMCGTINGIMFALLICFFISLFSFKVWQSKTYSHQDEIYKFLVYIVISLIILFPIIGRIANKNLWIGFNDEKQQLKSQGMSDIQIMQYLQALYTASDFNTDNIISKALPFALLQSKEKNSDKSPDTTN